MYQDTMYLCCDVSVLVKCLQGIDQHLPPALQPVNQLLLQLVTLHSM